MEDENNFSQAEWEIEEMNAGIQIVKKGRGAMGKLIAITGKQGVRVNSSFSTCCVFILTVIILFFFLPKFLCTFHYTRGKI